MSALLALLLASMPALDFGVEVDGPQPGVLQPGLACGGLARWTVGVSLLEAGRRLRLRCEGAKLDDVPLGTADLEVRWTPAGRVARIHVEGALAETLDAVVEGESVRVTARGLDLAVVSRVMPILALAGRADVELAHAPEGSSLRFDGRELRWRGEPVGALQVEARHGDETLELSARWGAHAKLAATVPLTIDWATLEPTWIDARPLNVELEAQGLTQAVLRPLWRAHPAADFEVAVRLNVSGTAAKMEVAGSLDGTLRDGAREALAVVGRLEGDSKRQRVRFALGEGLLEVELSTRAALAAIRAGRKRLADTKVEGRLALQLPLQTAAPYLPGFVYDPVGRVEGALEVAGTLGEPRFEGSGRTVEAALTLVPLNRRLTDFELEATAEGETFTLGALRANAGDGRLEGRGELRLDTTPAGAKKKDALWSAWRVEGGGALTLERFPMVREGVPFALLDARFEVKLGAGPEDASLEVVAHGARAALTELELEPARAIPRNARVRYRDWAGDAEPPENVFAGAGRLRVVLRLADPFRVEREDVALTVAGGITVEREGQRAKVDGRFDVLDGRFPLFENPFVVREGTLTLLGGDLDTRLVEGATPEGPAAMRDPTRPVQAVPLEAVVTLKATGHVVDTAVNVVVRGPARRPELMLTARPALPAYEIMALLVTGRVDAVDEQGGDVRRQVSKLVSRFHNPSLSRQLYDRLGVDKLGLGFGSSVSQPILTVGKQINRRLYLETVYRHNAPPDANEKEGHVEYLLARRWTLDTVYGDAAEGSVGVFWRTRFGGPPPEEAPEAEAP